MHDHFIPLKRLSKRVLLWSIKNPFADLLRLLFCFCGQRPIALQQLDAFRSLADSVNDSAADLASPSLRLPDGFTRWMESGCRLPVPSPTPK
jgi:hypothetical protein